MIKSQKDLKKKTYLSFCPLQTLELHFCKVYSTFIILFPLQKDPIKCIIKKNCLYLIKNHRNSNFENYDTLLLSIVAEL